VANPPNTVAKTVGQLWSDVREEVWFGSIFQRLLVFFDDFSKLTCDLGLFLVESFSGFKVLSIDVFWDLGRWLIHCRAV
jgi:hypothetical protein